MATEKIADGCEAVVAIDFGTARSGYAYAYTASKIRVEEEIAGVFCGTGKLPTVICLDAGGRYRSFGQQAVRDYYDPNCCEERIFFTGFKMLLYTAAAQKEWEGAASPEKKASALTDLMATAVDGVHQAKLLDLVAFTLRALAGHACTRLRRLNKQPTQENVRWVVTVPAIWTAAAKDFMRAAAKAAGFFRHDHQLLLCMESDAAAISMQPEFCFPQESRVTVVDMGGGTVDVTTQRVTYAKTDSKQLLAFGEAGTTANNRLGEIMASSGGAWGSVYIDAEFVRMLDDLFGAKTMQKYRETNTADWYAVLQAFETKKQEEYAIGADQGTVTIALPRSLAVHIKQQPFTSASSPTIAMAEFKGSGLTGNIGPYDQIKMLCEEYSKKSAAASATASSSASSSSSSWFSFLWSSSTTEGTVEPPAVVGQDATDTRPMFLRLSRKQFNSFVQPNVERTLRHMDTTFKQLVTDSKAPHHIVLVGGLAECKPMVDAFEAWVKQQDIKVRPQLHRPGRASVSVMTGAVRFGLDTRLISSRIMPWHYASSVVDPVSDQSYERLCALFSDPTVAIQRLFHGGKVQAFFRDVVLWLTKRGESCPVDHVVELYLHPSHDGQTKVWLQLFKAESRNHLLTTSADRKFVERLGMLDIPCPFTTMGADKRALEAYCKFSSEEFYVAARELAAEGERSAREYPWQENGELKAGFSRGAFKYQNLTPYVPLDDSKITGSNEKAIIPNDPKLPAASYEAVLLVAQDLETCPIQLQLLGDAQVHDLKTKAQSVTEFTSGVKKAEDDAQIKCAVSLSNVVLPTYVLVCLRRQKHAGVYYVRAPGTPAECVPLEISDSRLGSLVFHARTI